MAVRKKKAAKKAPARKKSARKATRKKKAAKKATRSKKSTARKPKRAAARATAKRGGKQSGTDVVYSDIRSAMQSVLLKRLRG